MIKKSLLVSLIFICPILFHNCVSDDINKMDCDNTDLAVTKSVTNTTTCSAIDGSITASATGGKSPYTFSIDGVDFSSSPIFNKLVSGNYTITVRDASGCLRSVEATVGGSGFTAIASVTGSGCNSSNGEIVVTASGGTSPYTYKIGSASFVPTNSFSSLSKGLHRVIVKDANDCLYLVNDIMVTTGVSYETDIKPILEVNCIKSGCHNGDNGAERNWTIFANVHAKASGIKTRTGNKSMPADIAPNGLPQNQIDLIACWVDDGALDN